MARPPELTLGKLFDMYEREVTPSKSLGVQKHDRRARALFESCWGRASIVKTLDRREWDRFIRLRRTGQLKPEHARHHDGVRDRMIELDLRFMVAVCNWALTVRAEGEPILTSNPFRGLSVPAEQSVNQPVTSDEEVAAMRLVAAKVHPLCPLYFELTYRTGHRCMAVGRLRWSDVDFSTGTVCWQAGHDKIGFEHVVPLEGTVLGLLQARRRAALMICDGWIFPSPTDPGRPISRNLVPDWWRDLERVAGIPHVRGRGWHSLRRRFATDLDHLPLKRLMKLGGWKTPGSVMRYQKPTIEQLRESLKTRRNGTQAPVEANRQ